MILQKSRTCNSAIITSQSFYLAQNDQRRQTHASADPWLFSALLSNPGLALLILADTSFPSYLPVPHDDGACAHLTGSKLPSVSLPSTSNTQVDLSTLSGLTILFCYPRTGAPNEEISPDWNAIAGVRGCTPQACAFRDFSKQLSNLGVAQLFGLRTQETEYQREAKVRNNLPYELLSDDELDFAKAMGLPTFEWEGQMLIKRLALALRDGRVVKVWYPVFPPDANAEWVVEWLMSGQEAES